MKERENRKMIEMLQKKGKELPIPEGLQPEQMYLFLQEREAAHQARKHWIYPHPGHMSLALAACVCLIVGMATGLWQTGIFSPGDSIGKMRADLPETAEKSAGEAVLEEEQEIQELGESSYEDIYACLSGIWEEQKLCAEEEVYNDSAVGDMEASISAGAVQQAETKRAFAKTNTQVEQVDEGDQIKNDGRYLYQIAEKRQEEDTGEYPWRTGIQILDTEGGLKETAFVDDFESLEEFYLWEDLLITIENKYYDCAETTQAVKKGAVVEDMAVCGVFREQGYHEISIYEVSDRNQPRKLKTFTLQGMYESSRVSDGYFYGISRFSASPGEGVQDYDAYIPSLDGRRMEPDQIYCPPDADSQDYLVLVSIDLSRPSSLSDSRAILAGSGTYYVSPQNIYVAWYQPVYEIEPQEAEKVKDMTRLLRFSYRKGRFYAQAEGAVPGRLDSSFSMDEYKGKLRLVSTVQEYEAREIVDDRTGQRLGYDYGPATETSGLYILDLSLDVRGKIEGLAEGEMIRSARFLGDTGYFVTFRQTDPLFAADLSDPDQPRILGELKVSGFSEYLHFYGENELLGLGMEADEATGREQGMKLSMFDLTDPANLKEAARYSLKEYDYSEALWDHRAMLVDPEENIIGFEARGDKEKYLVFSYRDGAFARELEIDICIKDQGGSRARGTFIGDRFYLLFGNGAVRAYDRNTKELVGEI